MLGVEIMSEEMLERLSTKPVRCRWTKYQIARARLYARMAVQARPALEEMEKWLVARSGG